MRVSVTGWLLKINQKELVPVKYEHCLLGEVTKLKINLKTEVIYFDNGSIEYVGSTIINLVLVGFFCSLGKQQNYGRCLLSSETETLNYLQSSSECVLMKIFNIILTIFIFSCWLKVSYSKFFKENRSIKFFASKRHIVAGVINRCNYVPIM